MSTSFEDAIFAVMKNNGETKPFSQHSKPTQKAIIQWMAIDGEAWFELIPKELHELYKNGWNDAEWNFVIDAINKTQGSKSYTFAEVPTQLLTDCIANEHEEISEDYDSWKEYHEYYLNGGDIPNHSSENRWPCIFRGGEELIVDGWHRLHCYVRDNHQTIPLVY